MSGANSFSYWDRKTLESRIDDSKARTRYEAGSPNQTEVELYRSCLLDGLSSTAMFNARILVLGMTPELRSLALGLGHKVISIDRSQDSINMYKDWTPDEHKANEMIIHASWWDTEKNVKEPINAVMGDGIFGNILSVEKHFELLGILKNILTDGGTMVFRKAILPDDFDFQAYNAELLIQKYRSGILSAAEFGFSMRLWGNYEKSYDFQNFILDNSQTFQYYQTLMKEGILTEPEYACICHYYFNGLNLILPQYKWEEILVSSGCSFKRYQLKGKDWYAYYPVYQCRF